VEGQDPLLQEVLRLPAEDGPRLAYAEAIAASDPDHAALIRLQMDILCGRGGTYREEQRLLRSVRTRITASVYPSLIQGFRVSRGFVEGGNVNAQVFVDRAAELIAKAPVLYLRPTGLPAVAKAFLERPELRQIRYLDLRLMKIEPTVVEALAASPHVRELRWLNLSQNELPEASLHAIASSPHLRNLQVLGFSDNVADDPTPQEIADERGFVHMVVNAPIQQTLADRYGALKWLKTPFMGVKTLEMRERRQR